MSSRTLQPSEYEIQREVEALRDIRRRSTTPGALTIDPDLPIQAPIPSSTSRARPAGSPTSPRRSPSDSSSSSFARSSSDRSSHGTSSAESAGSDPMSPGATDDPFHLFWVPASVHPEIAPAEFRAFLKEHARTVPPSEGGDLARVSSASSSSSSSALGRKRSMLRRQYQPREGDGVEQETVVPLRRNRSYLYNPVPQITFTDLQRLEQLAEEASESDDPSKLRSLLRRSLSLNLPPSAVDRMGTSPELGDEADAPIIVPPPGNILRRAARTKIRKPGLPGDGNGHRFGSSKRGLRAATLPSTADQRTSSDFSSSDHGDTSVEIEPTPHRRQTFSDDGFTNQRPDSFSDEALIFDAYARDEEDEQQHTHPSTSVTSSPPPQPPSPPPPPPSPPRDLQSSREVSEPPQLPMPEIETQLLDAFGPVLQQPLPQEGGENEYQLPPSSRTPSPPAPVDGSAQTDLEMAPPHPSPAQQSPSSSIPQQVAPQAPPAQPEHPTQPHQPQAHIPRQPSLPRKDKDKKSLFGIWGSDKSSKKSKQDKDKDKENRERPEKERDSSFFGSLFGGSKKKHESDITPSMVGGTAGREAAQALLGASKSSKNYIPPPSPGLAQGANPYARYPIHVERAIYRLSHIKLANPRRPLYEQVLISNLMFWYLGVINKTQNTPPSTQDHPNGQAASAGSDGPGNTNVQDTDADRELREKERLAQEQRERLEKEALERLEREKELEMKKKESGKRGSLTKTPAGGVPGGRRAEMPVRGPQYEMQHRVMEQEYGNYNMQSNQQVGRGPTPTNGVADHSYHRQQPQQYPNSSPKLVSPQPNRGVEQPHYDGKQQMLPAGAMAPTNQWAPNHVQQQLAPSPQRSRTPPANFPQMQRQGPPLPQDGFSGVGGRPGRSLSATAIPVPQANGTKTRKGSSVHVVPPSSQPLARRPKSREAVSGEEEDLPLATLWQQQQRRAV